MKMKKLGRSRWSAARKLWALQPQFVHPDYIDDPRKVKFGFDIHGVLDANTEGFSVMLQALITAGCEVHILTGGQWKNEEETLRKLGIPYTHFFSLVDYHIAIKTPMRWDKEGAHIDPYEWDRTKGLYCQKFGITMHFDNSDSYGYFFKSPYIRYHSNDSARVRKIHLV